MVAPKAAPEEVPIRKGSARGLRNMPWKRTPATASPLPTSAAPTTPGIRTCQTISSSVGSHWRAKCNMPVPFSRIFTMVLIGIGVEPKLTATSMTASSSPLMMSKMRGAGSNFRLFPTRCSVFTFWVAIFIM